MTNDSLQKRQDDAQRHDTFMLRLIELLVAQGLKREVVLELIREAWEEE